MNEIESKERVKSEMLSHFKLSPLLLLSKGTKPRTLVEGKFAYHRVNPALRLLLDSTSFSTSISPDCQSQNIVLEKP